MTRDALTNSLLATAEWLARQEASVAELTIALGQAKRDLALSRAEMLIEEGKVQGKNEAGREAHLLTLTLPLIQSQAAIDNDLRRAQAALDGQKYRFSALKAVARLITEEELER